MVLLQILQPVSFLKYGVSGKSRNRVLLALSECNALADEAMRQSFIGNLIHSSVPARAEELSS